MNENMLEQYRSDLARMYADTFSFHPEETPLGMVTTDLKEMISSYLTDAEVFYQREDLINEYAALLYAQGWLEAAIYLGYIGGSVPDPFFPEDIMIPCEIHDRLVEKHDRYDQMLCDALGSLDIAPESGSPLYSAAVFIRKKAEDATRNETSKTSYLQELGRLSYGYGWLDAGLRAGLYRILGNPHLFTTETRD